MYYAVKPTPAGKWQVILVATGGAFGDPFDTMEEAAALAREAEAIRLLDKFMACRGARCAA